MTMDARKQRVLQAIVALYGLEGDVCIIYTPGIRPGCPGSDQ